jgi:DtxR family Mn-dependent transcriptional regulator
MKTLSQRELDCLMAIESLTKAGWPARTSEIAKTLHVKAPSAVEIIGRLHSKHLLEKGPGGAKISNQGYRMLGGVHRSHRILETMLANLGIPTNIACQESKKIDRYLSKEVTRAFCSYLGHPKTCPDNMPIQRDPKCCNPDPGEM